MKDLKKNKDLIPNGIYCYSYNKRLGFSQTCPYWYIMIDKPEQENGYCAYMEEGDWENKVLSLIWDQCKECGENFEEHEIGRAEYLEER